MKRSAARSGLSAAVLLLGLMLAPTGADAATVPDGQHPRDRDIHDSDTRAWWHTTEALSGDSMEGRDTGSAAYLRAADYVAARFKEAALQPAGDGGTYFQAVLMHEIAVLPEGTDFTLVRADGSVVALEFLEQITIAPAEDLPGQLEAPLTFRGYCGKDALDGVAGKIVVCFGTQRAGLPSAALRVTNAREANALGLISVDDPYFTIEPPRWPFAYARNVSLKSDIVPPKEKVTPLAVMRVSAESFAALLAGTGRDAASILRAGGARQPLSSFEIPGKLRIHVHVAARDISSPNVLATLPGVDPTLSHEYVVASAHLDGYGFGTPVNGDNLYNGTLDDAAYVALLIQMADDIKSHKLKPTQRSLLFAAFTGEEKGLLGSNWFVLHPTLPLQQLAADVNLDQLRPLFPLNILTAEALADTTLADTARSVAGPLHIELRPDTEPERNLLRRADQYPFLAKQVPAISFIFGYDPGTEAERRYRQWYQIRYHRPQDDLTQPMDFAAAAKFNQFFYRLVSAIANDPHRPQILATSQFARRD